MFEHELLMDQFATKVSIGEVMNWLNQEWDDVRPQFDKMMEDLSILESALNVLRNEKCLGYLTTEQTKLVHEVLNAIMDTTHQFGGICNAMTNSKSIKPLIALLFTAAAEIVVNYRQLEAN